VGNYSSGKQGIAFARAAKHLGAEVRVIAANIDEENLSGFEYIQVKTASELQSALMEQLETIDILVMSAAVADFSIQNPKLDKIKRSEVGESLNLTLSANPDILREFVRAKNLNSKKVLTVGFAAEAGGNLEQLGKEKLQAKGCDFIVANDISNGSVFGSSETEVLLISQEGTRSYKGSKLSVANAVLGEVASKVGKL
jgi:phosphopantothenoylcysteine decarboxylase/phosphopantothenate--cysteine ligase